MHSIPFVQREIRHVGNPDPAVCAPASDPTQPKDWDLGIQAYKETFGEETWEKHKHGSYPRPMPADSPEQRQGLSDMVDQARLAFGSKAAGSGRRATHTTGVAGRGKLTIVSSPTFPEHPFFEAGKSFGCRLRHANASYNDDAAAVVRSCSIKFADSASASPLDVIMNSGPIGAFWNIESFMDFVQARVGTKPTEDDWESQKDWTMRRPMGFVGSIESIRIGPSSFADMAYYSKVVFPFVGKDGQDRYCKYRVMRVGLDKESGLPTPDRQRTIWAQGRNPDDTRPFDYLRQEYAGRVAKGPVEYMLQIQIRDADPETDTHEVFNMCHLWCEKSYPWHDLAHVQVEEILTEEEVELMKMWLGNQPVGLGLLEAYSVLDYRSMAHARALVYPGGQLAREIYRLTKGAPPSLGDKPYSY